MSSIQKEQILRINCPGFGEEGYLTVGQARPLNSYRVIIINPVSIFHIFDREPELRKEIDNQLGDDVTSLTISSDSALEAIQSDLKKKRMVELVRFLEKGGLLIYFLCRPFTVQGPTQTIDNYGWLESLAPDSAVDDDARHMSSASHGRVIEPTDEGKASEFATYLDQSGLEWNTIIRQDFLTPGYIVLATSGPRKCIAAQLPAGDFGGTVLFLPAPYSPDYDRKLIESVQIWYDKYHGSGAPVATTALPEPLAQAPIKEEPLGQQPPSTTDSSPQAEMVPASASETKEQPAPPPPPKYSPPEPLKFVSSRSANMESESNSPTMPKWLFDSHIDIRRQSARAAAAASAAGSNGGNGHKTDESQPAQATIDSIANTKAELQNITAETVASAGALVGEPPTTSVSFEGKGPARAEDILRQLESAPESTVTDGPPLAVQPEPMAMPLPETPSSNQPLDAMPPEPSQPEPEQNTSAEIIHRPPETVEIPNVDPIVAEKTDEEAAPTAPVPEAQDLIKKMEEISKVTTSETGPDVTFPSLDELRKKRHALVESIMQAQTEIAQIDAAIQQIDSLKSALLSAEMPELKEACLTVLAKLGWEAKQSDDNHQELLLTGAPGPEVIVRLVRSDSQVQRADIALLAESVITFWGKHEVEPKGLLVSLAWADKPLAERTESDYPDGLFEFAKHKNLCLMTTTQLLCMYRDLELGNVSSEEIRRNIFDCSGRLTGFQLDSSVAQP